MKNAIVVGSTVKYRREFLRSIGQCTGDMPFARGVVTELKVLGETTIAVISWNMPGKVNIKNLTLHNNPENYS